MRSMNTAPAARPALGATVLVLALATAAAPCHADGLGAVVQQAQAMMQAQAQAQAQAQFHAQVQPAHQAAPSPLSYSLSLAPARSAGLASGRPWGGGLALHGTDMSAAAGAHPAHAYPASAWQPALWAVRPAGVGSQVAATAPGADELQLRLSFKAHKPYEHLRGGQLVRLDLGAATALSLRPRGGRVLVQLHSRW